MFRKTVLPFALVAFAAWLVAQRADAADKSLVHPLFADHMVMQRNLPALQFLQQSKSAGVAVPHRRGRLMTVIAWKTKQEAAA
jgi:hypothetical protein